MKFREISEEERRRYYRHWSVKKVPKFIIKSLKFREFAFDHDGSGPSDRYRSFKNKRKLEKFIKIRAPYAIYSSVAFYEKPHKREGWKGAELVFDIDAKDLPIKKCKCKNACEICLEQAKDIVKIINSILRNDFGLEKIHIIYSGRGYHIRVLDKDVLELDSEVRREILKYVVGWDDPGSDVFFTIPIGYPKVFTKWMKYIFLNVDENSKVEGISRYTLRKIRKNREKIKKNEFGKLRIDLKRLIDPIRNINSKLVDTKVTIDVNRILRLPGSVHSKVGAVCTEVNNLDDFNPEECLI